MTETEINDVIRVYRDYREGESVITKDEKLSEDDAIWLYSCHSKAKPWFRYFDNIISIIDGTDHLDPLRYPLERDVVEEAIEENSLFFSDLNGDIKLQNKVLKFFIKKYEHFLIGNHYACKLIKPAPGQMNEIRVFMSELCKKKDTSEYVIEQMKEMKYADDGSRPKSLPVKDKYCVTAFPAFINKEEIKKIDENTSYSEEEKEYEIKFKNGLTPESRFYVDVSGECIFLWFEKNPRHEFLSDDSMEGIGLDPFIKELCDEKKFETRKESEKWMIFNPETGWFEPIKETISNHKIISPFFLRISHSEEMNSIVSQSGKRNTYYPYFASSPVIINPNNTLSTEFIFTKTSVDSFKNYDLFFNTDGLMCDLYPDEFLNGVPESADELFLPALSDFLHNYYYQMAIFIQCQRFAKGNILSTYLKKERKIKRDIRKGLKEYEPFLKSLAAGNVDIETAKPDKPRFYNIFFETINMDECSLLFKNIRDLITYVETEKEKTIARFVSAITGLTLFSVFTDISNFAYSYTVTPSPNIFRIAFQIGVVVLGLALSVSVFLLINSFLNRRR